MTIIDQIIDRPCYCIVTCYTILFSHFLYMLLCQHLCHKHLLKIYVVGVAICQIHSENVNRFIIYADDLLIVMASRTQIIT